VTKAPMALMNMVSSNINQWTILAAMIPILYGWSHLRAHGTWADFTFDGEQEVEIALTIAQSMLAALLLLNLRFNWFDATSLFVLWLVQFVVPSWREEIAIAYLVWCGWIVLMFIMKRQDCAAPRVFLEVFRENRKRRSESRKVGKSESQKPR
jgi:cation:H+ antiporter